MMENTQGWLRAVDLQRQRILAVIYLEHLHTVINGKKICGIGIMIPHRHDSLKKNGCSIFTKLCLLRTIIITVQSTKYKVQSN